MGKLIDNIVAFLVLLFLSASQAQAATSDDKIKVNAIIGTACGVSASPIDFGSVVATDGAVTSGTITVICTPGVGFGVALGGGGSFDGSSRRMIDPQGEFVPYELYSPLWGLWGDGGVTHPGAYIDGWTSTGENTFSVDAEIPPQPSSLPGGYYSDIVLVTVFY